MIETIVIALIVCKAKGYEINKLFKTWHFYPVLIFELIYFIGQVLTINGEYWANEYIMSLKSLYLCSYIFLILKYELYKSAIVGAGSMLLGGFMNDIAIKANGGFMPVFPSLSIWTGHTVIDKITTISDLHILGDGQTKFKIFTDFIDVGFCVLSIGDIFIRVFVFLILYNSIKESNKHTKEKIKC